MRPQFQTKNPQFKEYIESKTHKQFFMKLIGFELTDIGPGWAEGRIEKKQELLQQNGFLHGGVTATLGDLVTGFAAFSLVEYGKTVVTADLKISYFHPGSGGYFIAKGWVEKTGNLMHFCEAQIEDSNQLIIAKCHAIMVTVDLPVTI